MRDRRWLALLVVLVLAMSACGGDDDDDAIDTGDDAAQDDGDDGDGDEITITATDYEFDAPTEITGGTVTINFENEGDQTHEAGFLQVEGGVTADDLVEDFKGVFEGGPFPETWTAVAGIGEIEGGESITSTITLPEGEYWLICALQDESDDEGEDEGEEPVDDAAEGQPSEAAGDEGEGEGEEAPIHIELGMAQEVNVSGDNGAELPDGPSITAEDYEFTAEGIEAGDQTVTFRNEGPEQWHHVVLFAFEEGVDEAQAREAFAAFAEAEESGSPPPEGTPEPEEAGGSFVFSPGMGGTFDATFESGRLYAALCFVSDLEGGPPHAFAHEMVSFFTVE